VIEYFGKDEQLDEIAHILILSTFTSVRTSQMLGSNVGTSQVWGPCSAEHVEHALI
jgi:hypothetical protein